MNERQNSPYFDTHKSADNHRHVLFAAGRPVQARELNEAQSILSSQIGMFADHIFKNGSRVSNGAISIIGLEYVRIKDLDTNGETVDASKFKVNKKLRGATSGVTAQLVTLTEKDDKDPLTLYVIYTAYGIDAQQNRFLNGENVEVLDENDNVFYTVTVRCPLCPNSTDAVDEIDPCAFGARLLNVADGVFYYNGFFVTVNAASVVFSKYGNPVTCKIGFDVIERVKTAEDDVSLYDNALGYPNEASQGADREVLEFVLVKRDNVIGDGTQFVELASIEDGYVQTLKSDVQYADIMDTMAKRTFEESGNYTVVPFDVRYREHKKKDANDNVGFKLDGDESLVQAVIGTGIGYVKGYRTETLFEQFVNVPKARATKSIQNGSLYFGEGAYIDLVPDDTMSVWPNMPNAASILTLKEIQLYDGDPVANAPTGQVVGTVMVTDAVYMGTDSQGKAIWRYFVTNVRMNPNAGEVKCVSNETARFLAVPHGTFQVRNATQQNLFYDLGLRNVKSLRDSDNNTRGSIRINTRVKLNASLDASGNYTFTTSNGVFSSSTKDTIIIVGDAGNYVSVPVTPDNVTPAGTTLSLALGGPHAGKNVHVIHGLLNIDLIEKTKQSATHIISGINRVSSNNFQTKIKTGKADAYAIEYVKAYSSQNPSNHDFVTDKFELLSNVSHYHYGESEVKLKSGVTVDNAFDSLEVKIRYFIHSDTNNSGYFTIDSYKTVLNDDDSGITYSNLPVAIGYDGSVYSIDRIIDFRPIAMEGNADIHGTSVAIKETATFDAEYYVPRKDYLCLDKAGLFFHEMGVPSDNPKLPNNLPDDIMPLYEVYIPAYTYSYQDIKIKRIENKRYTMRDIGRLEKRIDNLEYYTTLSMLESQAASANVKDANGLDRFKNGFVVDDFSKHATGETTSHEFKCTIDRERKELRPTYSMTNRKAKINTTDSSNFVIKNGIAMLPHTLKLADEQPFASRPLSINPHMIFRKRGNLVLTPNVDTWADVTRAPELVVDIDTGVDALRSLTTRQNNIVTAFNDWQFANSTISNGTVSTALGSATRTSSSTTITNTDTTRSGAAGTPAGLTTRTTTTATTTTTTTDVRTETMASIESRTNTYAYDAVTDVRIIPYMRATQIEFTASGLMPNTRYYVFFDNQNVTPITTILGSTENISNALSSGLLLSNDKGVLRGLISIPEGRFFIGARDVRVTNDPHNTKDEKLETSFAETQFFAGGVNTQRQQLTMNVVSAIYNEQDVVKVNTSTSSRTTQRTNIVVSGRQNFLQRDSGGRGGDRDPIAQSFKIDYDCFVGALDLYFETVEPTADIIFEIREMDNGYPTETILGKKIINGRHITPSLDASVATRVEFPVPVRLQSGREYCFVIGGDSPATRVWIAKLGEPAVNVPNKLIDTQVTLGSSFRSQNGSTWNAEQYEDIMYKLYICEFNKNEMKLSFDISGGAEFSPLADAPFETQTNSNLVRVYTKDDHALVIGDKVQIAMYPEFEYHATLTNGHLVAGHELTIANGQASGLVKSVEYVTPTTCIVKFALLSGKISQGDNFIAAPQLRRAGNKDMLEAYLDIDAEDYDIKQAAGSFTQVIGAISTNGIPLEMLNKAHQVKRVDDNHTFVIEVNQQALETGRFGASGSMAILNHKADLVNLAGARVLHDASETWTIQGASHGEAGSLFEGDNYTILPVKEIQLCADRYLDRPIKVASLVNETERMASRASVVSIAKFKTTNKLLSPMVNVETFSATFVSNDVEWTSADLLDRDPNGAGRFKPETNPEGGSEHFVYVTKTAVLKNPAADLRLWFDVFKPSHADVDVYVKLKRVSDDNIDTNAWIKVEGYDKTATTSNPDELIEVDIMLGDIMPAQTGLNNMFSEYKVKLVGRSKNSSIPPLVKNLRAIAYT